MIYNCPHCNKELEYIVDGLYIDLHYCYECSLYFDYNSISDKKNYNQEHYNEEDKEYSDEEYGNYNYDSDSDSDYDLVNEAYNYSEYCQDDELCCCNCFGFFN